MAAVIFWTLVYSVTTAASIVLLGHRDLISGNLWSVDRVIALLLNWKFILSLVFALGARFSFVLTNNALLSIPELAPASTTITTFITLVCLVFVVLANVYFLKERLVMSQMAGAALIMVGIVVMLGTPHTAKQITQQGAIAESANP